VPIAVTCTGCGKELRVKDEFIGKRLKCSQCGVTFTAEAPPDDSGQKIADRVSAQIPAVLGLLCIAGGLGIAVFTQFARGGLAVVGLGIASLGELVLSSSNRDDNF